MFTAIVSGLGPLAGQERRAWRGVAESAAALAIHRRVMWVREDLRLRGEDCNQART
ncbi:hypothetical protein ACFZAV_27180 [Streptomyces sp. NPDC008343]|uniref:hypothetical protein n=1 Tax=Streptomyces sp. NPDC008343 TaxID=3364828 RepID=UPI0036EBD902